MEQKKFEHSGPAETQEKVHRIDLYVAGENIGHADLEYSSNPFPFYYFSLVFIDKKARGKHYGKNILEEVNSFLDARGRPGILFNAIDADDPGRTMYEKSGWRQIEGKINWFGYNLPQDLDTGRLEKAIYSIEKTQRKRYKTFSHG